MIWLTITRSQPFKINVAAVVIKGSVISGNLL